MITCQRHLFRLPPEVSYLNCAYMSPLLRSAEAAGCEALGRKALPFDISIKDFFEPLQALKESFARLINLSEPNRIALIPAVSYGMATVARNLSLRAGDNIVLTGEQFPSNYYSWQRLARETGAEVRVVAAPDGPGRPAAWNESLLAAVDERTVLLTLGHVHWADGTLFDLRALRARTREVGAWLVIDGTQSVGALPFDVAEIEPDALVCAGYKWLLGPYSLGLAYYGPAFDGGVPIEENWINRLHSEDFKNLVHYQPEYQPLAARYSVGEQSNFSLVPVQLAAIRQLLAWGPPAIQAYCRHIARSALAELQEMGCRLTEEQDRAHHLFGVRLSGRFDEDRLQAELQQKRVYVSFRGSAVRIAPHLYNDEADFQKLVDCFAAARHKRVI